MGLAVGSFLNVVIARVPERRSLWQPGSACPRCGTPIAWYDNVPLLSFAVLRGRCRACGKPIAWRYPLVEAVTGALFGAAYLAFGPTPDFAFAVVLLGALVAITVIDLERQIIPDLISLPGIVAGVVANLATGRVPWLDALVGILVGAAPFFVIILVRPEGMGGGDLKLGAMLGAFLGWKVFLVTLFLAVVPGGILAAILMVARIRGRKDPIPFGPFLAAGGAAGLFWGERMVRWYLDAFAG